MKSISVVIPAYNEALRLPRTLERVIAYLTAGKYDYEIIVVDDGSTDGTRRVVEATGDTRTYFLGNGVHHGKGYAVRRGVLAARNEWILTTDADLSAPIEELPRLMEAGADVAIGSRALPGSTILTHQPRYREYGGKLFNVAVRTMLLPGVFDTQCGFKLFRREAAHNIMSRVTLEGFAFDVETLFIARKLGYLVAEIPITWTHNPETKVRVRREAFASLADLFRIRSNGWRGWYNNKIGTKK